MTEPFKFERILSIKENEKQQKRLEYEAAMKHFEEAAFELYHCLKQKEELEHNHILSLRDGLSITELIQYSTYLQNLEVDIAQKQLYVFQAREKMQEKKQAYINQNIEVQKYEILKEKLNQRYALEQKSLENHIMDEISIQQYNNREK